MGVVPDLAPMLADRGVPAGSLEGWAVEPKLDGWRVTVAVDPALPGGVAVRTRRGHRITDMVPGIEALAGSGYQVGLYGGPQVAICTDCLRMMYEDIGPVEPTRRPESDGETIVSFSETRQVTAAPQPEVEK